MSYKVSQITIMSLLLVIMIFYIDTVSLSGGLTVLFECLGSVEIGSDPDPTTNLLVETLSVSSTTLGVNDGITMTSSSTGRSLLTTPDSYYYSLHKCGQSVDVTNIHQQLAQMLIQVQLSL